MVLRILAVKEARQEPLQAALGVPLLRTRSVKPIECYEGELGQGPLAHVELRVNQEAGNAILILAPRPGTEILQSDVELGAFGDSPPALDVNPDIPPEGSVAYLFGPPEKRLHLAFTARTKRLRTVAVHWQAQAARSPEVGHAGLFARKPDARAEVRRCARCQEVELVCVRAWEHAGRAGVITRDCVCQHCGARVKLYDPEQIRAIRRTAWLMIWALFPTPFLLWTAHARTRAWARHPLVPAAPFPLIRDSSGEPNRRCGKCGQVAQPVSVTRHRHNGIPAGTEIRYRCGGCAASFEVKGGIMVGLLQSALLIGGGVVCVVVADEWMVRFLGGPLMAAIGAGLGRESIQSLRTAVRNPKLGKS